VQLLADLTPLRESPAFRRLWAGSTLSAVGGAMTSFALTLQVWDLTRSTAAVGLVALASLLPLLAAGLLGGALIDAADPRRLALGCTSALAALSALLTLQAWLGLDQVGLLYALAALQSAFGAVNAPARRSLTTALLPARQQAPAQALQRISFQVMMIAGPALAGLVAGAPHLGLRGCYLVDTVSFGCALYGLGSVPKSLAGENSPPDHSERTLLSSVSAGFSFIRRTPVLTGAFLTDICATFFGLPTSLFPALNADRFGGDPRTLGLFTAAVGVGGMVTAVLSGPLKHVTRQGAAMLVGATIWGAAFAVFAVAHSLWLTLLALAVAGAADTITVVARGTIVSIVTPAAFRGRVMAADYVVGAGGPQLGSVEAGAVGSLTTPVVSALSGGLLVVACTAAIALALPAFRRYRVQVQTGEERADRAQASLRADHRGDVELGLQQAELVHDVGHALDPDLVDRGRVDVDGHHRGDDRRDLTVRGALQRLHRRLDRGPGGVGDLLPLGEGGDERLERVRVLLRPRLRDHVPLDRELLGRALVEVGQRDHAVLLLGGGGERLGHGRRGDLPGCELGRHHREGDWLGRELHRRQLDPVLGQHRRGQQVVNVEGRVDAENVALQPGQGLDLGVRHRVDRLGALLHHRALGDDLKPLVLVDVMLDVGDVVPAGDVVLTGHLLVDDLVAADGGGVVNRQAPRLEQALVQGDEESGRIDRGDHGHVERGLF
jgi:MFS family permease